MDSLKEILLSEDVFRDGNILKVDTFLNQNVDIKLMNDIATEFYEYFKNTKITKVVTIESGGIPPAMLLAQKLGCDVLILKKSANFFSDEIYGSTVKSYTKNTEYLLNCAKENINKDDKFLFVDDFLANGQAFLGVQSIIEQGEAELVGVGIIIEKSYQDGAKIIDKCNIEKHSIVKVKEFKDNSIIWG